MSLQDIKRSFSLDYRSLALYRVLIGFIVMADVLYRLPDLTNFYTDIGLIPRSIFVSEMSMPWSFSLHLANGSFLWMAILFGLHLLFGLMLVVGFKSRWAMIGAFIMTVSVHNRNWLVNNGGDDILRAILFISMFLPLNRFFSLDSALQKKREIPEGPYFSTWGLVFFLQVFCIYFVSYILKDHPMWRKEFTALFYAARLDIFATPWALWLREFHVLHKVMTIFTIFLEWGGPLLLIFSFLFGRFWWVARSIVVLLFWSLHLGIIATMWIGVFPYLCLVMWTIFLPGPLWDKFLGHFRTKGYGKLTMYYDGDCGFCRKGVLILKEFLLLSEVEIWAAQDFPEIYRRMQENNSWVIVNEKGERFFHFAAFLELLRHSPLLKWMVPFFSLNGIFKIGTRIYIWVSHHRSLMGKASQFLTYRSHKKKTVWFSWLTQASGAFIFITLLMWNLTTIKRFNIKAPFFQTVTRWLHLYQEWNMFAPFPKTDNIWVEIPGTLEDGSEIEVLTGERDIHSIKDKLFYASIPNEHWRKFYLNLSDRTDYARYYGGYLCRAWNERKIRHVKDQTLRKLEIIVYSQLNLADGDKGGINRKLSWRHWCFDEDYDRDNPAKKHKK